MLAKPQISPQNLVSFIYKGGSIPGRERIALILEDRPKEYRCWDFEARGFRIFKKNLAVRVSELIKSSYKIIKIGDLPDRMSDEEKLVQAYLDEGYSVYSNGEKVVAVKQGFDNSLRYNRATRVITIPVSKNKKIVLEGNVVSDVVTIYSLNPQILGNLSTRHGTNTEDLIKALTT